LAVYIVAAAVAVAVAVVVWLVCSSGYYGMRGDGIRVMRVLDFALDLECWVY